MLVYTGPVMTLWHLPWHHLSCHELRVHLICFQFIPLNLVLVIKFRDWNLNIFIISESALHPYVCPYPNRRTNLSHLKLTLIQLMPQNFKGSFVVFYRLRLFSTFIIISGLNTILLQIQLPNRRLFNIGKITSSSEQLTKCSLHNINALIIIIIIIIIHLMCDNWTDWKVLMHFYFRSILTKFY